MTDFWRLAIGIDIGEKLTGTIVDGKPFAGSGMKQALVWGDNIDSKLQSS